MLKNGLEIPKSSIKSALGRIGTKEVPNLNAEEVDSTIYLTALYLYRASQIIGQVNTELSDNLLVTSDSLLEIIEKEPMSVDIAINKEEIDFIKEAILNELQT